MDAALGRREVDEHVGLTGERWWTPRPDAELSPVTNQMTRFSDRAFYSDWWNSTSFDEVRFLVLRVCESDH